MELIKTLFTSFLVVAVLSTSVYSKNTPTGTGESNGGSGIKPNTPSLAAGCAAAATSTELALNNVRTLIHSGGDMWWNFQVAQYEVPKGKGVHSLFAGSLWMGGMDVNGQLKLAAQRFRQGVDFWPGPLNTKTVDIDIPSCLDYDKHFVTTRQEVELFNSWYTTNITNPAQAAIEFPGYTIPKSILDWPAHGNSANNEDYYLAPFFDRNGDGNYNPYDGDYPGYELVIGQSDCRTNRDVKIYGDQNLWWVFNDKGNIHTETGGAPIGMEIRAQAFAFATNDEINNMTFYNYELVNRSTFVLTETYFGVWVDADLGRYDDDFVGCDVARGLGYCYNGKEIDGTGGPGEYGSNPPAVGVDFFEGPYQDNDGIDNPAPYHPFYAPQGIEGITYTQAKDGKGIPYWGLGIGYGDGVVDNERFGMMRFLYHNIAGLNAITDPQNASDYYNFLRGIWKDGTRMRYFGNGHSSGGGNGIECSYMFPGKTDTIGWGTSGQPQPNWTEESEGNQPYDRRFAQSAGPFTLQPGAVNNITVGVVWARALSGGAYASVEKLRTVDDKAQSLFDNCFRILNGPDAPDLSVKEFNKELILMLNNKRGTNNFNETYEEVDFRIPPEIDGQASDNKYRFQGYLIYQVKDGSIGPDDLGNPEKARLTAQCDIRDNVTEIISFRFDEQLKVNVPEEIVIYGQNKGISNTFRVIEDKFATGDRKLVNFKPYYFIAVAYAYNNYKQYSQNDPDCATGACQTKPYLLSRKGSSGGIRAIKGIPRNVEPLNGGTILNSNFGDRPMITRLDGQGNGGFELDFTKETEDEIVAKSKMEKPKYLRNRGPINVKVIDPLSVKRGKFELTFDQPTNIDTSRWTLTNLEDFVLDGTTYLPGEYKVTSNRSIAIGNEQILLDLGISFNIEQAQNPGDSPSLGNGFISASIEFEDKGKEWLTGVPDRDGDPLLNWIRSGTINDRNVFAINDYPGKDPFEIYEKVLGGTWAPYGLTAFHPGGPAYDTVSAAQWASLNRVKSIDIVFTDDKDKWTRCPVIEIQNDILLAEGGARKGTLRKAPSVGKDGKPDNTGTGMGWFPGYAVCLETGERLNMAFGEDSWQVSENGRDMIWNPTSNVISPNYVTRAGGFHYIYVFDNNSDNNAIAAENRIPAYDQGEKLKTLFETNSTSSLRSAWRSCMWVGFPLLARDAKLLATDVRIKLRVSRRYGKYTATDQNNGFPKYEFDLSDMAAITGKTTVADSALSMLNIVPNPYYAQSPYESNQLDTRVRLINLPESCTISIYTVNGTLVRRYIKADPNTFLDWDLKNHVGIPISSGIYLVHVKVPDVGERTLKWLGVMRPVDLESF
jgi:hypothetical protein